MKKNLDMKTAIEIASISGLFDKELRERNIKPEKIRKEYCKMIPRHFEFIDEEKVIFFIDRDIAHKVYFRDNEFFECIYKVTRNEFELDFKLVKNEKLDLLSFLEKYDYLGRMFLRIFNPADVVNTLMKSVKSSTSKEEGSSREEHSSKEEESSREKKALQA